MSTTAAALAGAGENTGDLAILAQLSDRAEPERRLSIVCGT
jgi:hypothetical protein